MDYKRVHNVTSVNTVKRRSPEERYWLSFKIPTIVKEYGPITCINFCPVKPHTFAVCSSLRVRLYSPQTRQIMKGINVFKSVARTCCYRQDGKLLAVGDANGVVYVFNVSTRSCLRKFNSHNQAVNVVKFAADKTKLISVSDDKTICVWDVTSQDDKPIVFDDNTDYIRALAVSASNPSKFATGSYDHFVKIYDLESKTLTLTIDHQDPVESLLFYPGDAMIVVCGGSFVKVYDTYNGKCVAVLGNFEKTVTCVCFDGTMSRLIVGSLDQNIKIYNSETFTLVASMKYKQPILSVAMSPDDTALVVGTASGLLSIKTRELSKSSALKNQLLVQEKSLRAGSLAYFKRTATNNEEDNNYVVETRKSQKLAKYDVFLKSFQYGKALDQVINNKYKLFTSLSVIEEIIARKGLRVALSGRDASSLNPIIKYVKRHIMKPEGEAIMIELANELFDIYGSHLDEFPNLASLVNVVQFKINDELNLQNELALLKGSMDMILVTSQQNSI
ncbi:hypothetical protein BB560_006431 [Smittium megazygosporum]|uniref:U3 small nucleolar RNA-associated protein 15 C-terminal domain-containing protein n=1 Tax=Smittium megazygosporum TaxID=133381 RepID=A0A2T9Y694_9FUNG|nr:hypothetical protein BB560_006431 [Smittium megazygosporum]